MPRRVSNISPKDFEPRRKNAVSLGSDSNIDNDFKAFKIGDIPTGLEFKLGEIRSNASNFVTLKETTEELFVTKIKGNKSGYSYTPQLLIANPDDDIGTNGIWFNVLSTGSSFINVTGDDAALFLESDTLQYYHIGDDSGNSFIWKYGDLSGSSTSLMNLNHEGSLTLYSTADANDYFKIAIGSAGATTISTVDNSGSAADLHLDADGVIKIDAAPVGSSDSIQFIMDGNVSAAFQHHHSATYLRFYENGGASTSDYLDISCGANGATLIQTVDGAGADAHLTLFVDGHVQFDGCGVGFDLETPTYNASDTDVDFRQGNKQFVTFGSGNITDLNLQFPAVSGNFVVLLKQDGTGSRTVTNYKAFDSAGNAANGSATVKFAGGSNPTLTTDANHVDIVSIFWDSDNEIAYGVASLDFQF